jgi:hypothetical protein
LSLAPYRERANAASTLCSARNLSSCFSGAICEQDRCGREGQAWVSRSHRGGRYSWKKRLQGEMGQGIQV